MCQFAMYCVPTSSQEAGSECEIDRWLLRTYTIHVEEMGSDCSIGRGSHMSRVWRGFDESAYAIEEMRLGYCVMLRGEKLENVWSMVFGGVHARHTSCMWRTSHGRSIVFIPSCDDATFWYPTPPTLHHQFDERLQLLQSKSESNS